MNDREKRVARNAALFREVNERVSEVHAHWASSSDRGTMTVVCECGREDCAGTIHIDRSEYEAVRADGARFIVLAGHETPDDERVIERARMYFVVEKTGAAKSYAESFDPRSA